MRPQPELYSQLRPNQDNGVPVQILNSGCELADGQGHPIPISSCEDTDITFRYLEGDVTPDCIVDVMDAEQVAFRSGSHTGELLYKPRPRRTALSRPGRRNRSTGTYGSKRPGTAPAAALSATSASASDVTAAKAGVVGGTNNGSPAAESSMRTVDDLATKIGQPS